MRSFLILCSVISAAYAASLGYDYEKSNGLAVGGGFSGGQVGGFGSGGQAVSGPSYSSSSHGGGLSGGPVGGFSSGGQGFGGPSYSSSGFGGGLSGGQVGGLSFGGQGVAGPSYAETTKEFFTFTAPEHEFNVIGGDGGFIGSQKKNLRVIFIKGPENTGLENAALQLAKSAVNERTAIYVLNKQADIGDLANKLQSLNHRNSNKPEVHFIKYRTPGDAEYAQQAIQSQYDSLNGPSSSHNGGVAPVLDYASRPASVPVAQQSYAAGPVGIADNSYLPPHKRT